MTLSEILNIFIPMAERTIQRTTDPKIKAKYRGRLYRWRKQLNALKS